MKRDKTVDFSKLKAGTTVWVVFHKLKWQYQPQDAMSHEYLYNQSQISLYVIPVMVLNRASKIHGYDRPVQIRRPSMLMSMEGIIPWMSKIDG